MGIRKIVRGIIREVLLAERIFDSNPTNHVIAGLDVVDGGGGTVDVNIGSAFIKGSRAQIGSTTNVTFPGDGTFDLSGVLEITIEGIVTGNILIENPAAPGSGSAFNNEGVSLARVVISGGVVSSITDFRELILKNSLPSFERFRGTNAAQINGLGVTANRNAAAQQFVDQVSLAVGKLLPGDIILASANVRATSGSSLLRRLTLRQLGGGSVIAPLWDLTAFNIGMETVGGIESGSIEQTGDGTQISGVFKVVDPVSALSIAAGSGWTKNAIGGGTQVIDVNIRVGALVLRGATFG